MNREAFIRLATGGLAALMIEIRPRSDESAKLGNAVVVESGEGWMDVRPTGPCPGGVPKLLDIVNVYNPKSGCLYLNMWGITSINQIDNTYRLSRLVYSGGFIFDPGDPIQVVIIGSIA